MSFNPFIFLPLSLPSFLSSYHPSPPSFVSSFSIFFLSFFLLSLSLPLKKQKFRLFFPTLADVIMSFPQRISLSLSLSLSWWRKHTLSESLSLSFIISLHAPTLICIPKQRNETYERIKTRESGWEWRTQERIALTMGMNYKVLSSNCISSFLELYEFSERRTLKWIAFIYKWNNWSRRSECSKESPAITVFFSFSHFPFLYSFHHSSLKLCTSPRIFRLLSQSLLLRENLSNQFFMSVSICMKTQQSPC